jgi:uncharacterized protein (TIGR03435 family)
MTGRPILAAAALVLLPTALTRTPAASPAPNRAAFPFLTVASFAFAQASTTAPPARTASASPSELRFEVATIKPIDPNGPAFTGTRIFPSGRLLIRGVSLKTLIEMAYHVSPWQVSGANGWMDRDRFNVEATPPQLTGLNLHYSVFGIEDERLRTMLQALLADRFQLSVHLESRAGPVYLLVREGTKLNLKASKQPVHPAASDLAGNIVFYVGEGWNMFNTSMPQLAHFISDRIADRPVLDHTGLEGLYGFQSSDVPSAQETTPQDYQAAFFAFLKEAGLKLQPSTGSIDKLVVDHAESPSPN